MPGSLYKKDGKLLVNSSKLTTNSNCCCADNICRVYLFDANPVNLSWGMSATLTASGENPGNCSFVSDFCNPAGEIIYTPGGLSGSFSCDSKDMRIVDSPGSAVSGFSGLSINFGLAPNSTTDYGIRGKKIREYKNYYYINGSCIHDISYLDVVSGVSGNVYCDEVNGICFRDFNVAITRYQISFDWGNESVFSIIGVAIYGYSIPGIYCNPTRHTLLGSCGTLSTTGDLYQIRQGCTAGPLYSYVNSASLTVCVDALPPLTH